MGLLDQLRQEDPSAPRHRSDHATWNRLPELLAAAVPGYHHQKTTIIRGEIIIQGSFPHAARARHFYTVVHSSRTAEDPANSGSFPHADLLDPPARPGRARPTATGISLYRAEAETNYYMYPWVTWLEPTPEAVAEWLSRLATTTTKDTPDQERRHRAK